jgi:hypothetical protein
MSENVPRMHYKSSANDMELFCFGFALNKNMLKFVLVLWFVVLVPIVNVVYVSDGVSE